MQLSSWYQTARCRIGLLQLRTKTLIIVGLVCIKLFLLHYASIVYIVNHQSPHLLLKGKTQSVVTADLPTPPVYKKQTKPITYPKHGTGKNYNTTKEFDSKLINSFCFTKVKLKAVVPIYSSPGDFIKRAVLRNSFGKWALSLNCKIFFIVGITNKKNIHERMVTEYARTRDLLVINKFDAYRELNNKAFKMVQFIDRYCRHVPYVIHLVDDTFVHLEKFLERLQSIETPHFVLGGLENKKTVRAKLTRTFVTPEEYPYERFPIYTYGCAYAFPTSIAKLMMQAAVKAPYIWIEDVWFTGHVRQTAGIGIVPLQRGELTHNATKAEVSAYKKQLPEFFVIHQVPLPFLEELYKIGYQKQTSRGKRIT